MFLKTAETANPIILENIVSYFLKLKRKKYLNSKDRDSERFTYSTSTLSKPNIGSPVRTIVVDQKATSS